MIVTILPSSSAFHAVDYNERKVDRGDARLLEMHNIPEIEQFGSYRPEELRNFFIDYSARNSRITKPQFHIAISCKGNEYTPSQLLAFAHEYLDRMGYNDPGQPWVVYSHHDTENTHIHIVTSRVAPDGHKIDHNHERRRSQNVINDILNINPHESLHKAMKQALEYHPKDMGQWGAVMAYLGYETKVNKESGLTSLFRHGVKVDEIRTYEIENGISCRRSRQTPAESADIESQHEGRKKQLKQIFRKYRESTSDRREFAELMKKQFGIDLVFYGSSDRPYGYTVIDHKTKAVFSGKEILPVKQLIDGRSVPLDRLAAGLGEVERLLKRNPYATIRDMNRALSRKLRGVSIRGEQLRCGNEEPVQLPPNVASTLKLNNRMEYGASFMPRNDEERAVVAGVLRLNSQYFAEFLDNRKTRSGHASNTIRTGVIAMAVKDACSRKQLEGMLKKEGITTVWVGRNCYFVDKRSRAIAPADSIQKGLSARIASLPAELSPKRRGGGGGVHRENVAGISAGAVLPQVQQQDGISSTSREWEVKEAGEPDNLDEQHHLGQASR